MINGDGVDARPEAPLGAPADVQRADVVIVGGGHNGLTAAAYLAKAGHSVVVLEASDHLGGAAISVAAFPGVPARLSRYSYLISLLPQHILDDLGISLELAERRYSSYTPVPSDPALGLLVDNDSDSATAASFAAVTRGDGGANSAAPPTDDFVAWQDFYARLRRLAEVVFPTMTQPLPSMAKLRAELDDDALWTAVVERPLGEVIEATFRDDTVRGVVATDALIGTLADLHGEDLRQNICFLYHLIGRETGEWNVPVGGMGAFTDALAAAARSAGADLRVDATVTAINPTSGLVESSAGRFQGRVILAACAPKALNAQLAATGHASVPTDPMQPGSDHEGAQLKVNMVLARLPRLRDEAVDPVAAFAGTFHINEGYEQLQAAYAAAAAGALPGTIPCEIYCHTLSDRSILGPDLADSPAQTLTLFGLQLPAGLFRADPTAAASALEATLASLNSVLAEPIEDCLLRDANGQPCIEVSTPLDIEAAVGMPGGNIFHRPVQWPWAEVEGEVGTWGVETSYPNLFLAGAGARRGGGVSGIPGHNAAQASLAYLASSPQDLP